MNFANVLTGVLRRASKPVFATSNGLLAQHTRNTFILRRKFRFPLQDKKRKQIKMSSRHFVYEMVENQEMNPQKPIDVILTRYVAGCGAKGEKLSLPPMRAYNKFLLPGLAVYASPENLIKYKEIMEKAKNDIPEYSSPWALRTMLFLRRYLLSVVVSQDHPWTLKKFHIVAAFRKRSIHLTEDTITMPEREITGPNLENEGKQFFITVTINKREQVKVRCRLQHHTNKESAKLPYTEFWKMREPALFPEDQPILDSIPKFREPKMKS